jgi:hypothetical protein
MLIIIHFLRYQDYTMPEIQLSLSQILESASLLVGSKLNQHGNYAPRIHWFKRGFDAISQNPSIFSDPEVFIRFGVTKSMVDSMRQWLLSFNLAVSHDGILTPTPFAVQIFSDESGLDPYLEDLTTLGLLHWKLLSPPAPPAWYWFFNCFTHIRFRREEALLQLSHWANRTMMRVTDRAIAADWNTFLKMYSNDGTVLKLEQEREHIFRDLNLLSCRPDWQNKPEFEFNAGSGYFKTGKVLRPELIGYAALDFVQRQGIYPTYRLSDLAYQPGSPGRAFRLGESDLGELLGQLNHPELKIEENAEYKLSFRYGNAPGRIRDELLLFMALG